jgi:hypothetical protein
MKKKLPLFLATLLLASLACTMHLGGPEASGRPTIPVSTEAAETLKDQIRRAFEAGAASGQVTIQITESQMTSLLAQRFQSDPSLQQDQKPFITDPQVYLRDGQMQVFAKTQQGIFTANISIVLTVTLDENAKPKIEITSANFGPLPIPEGLTDTISAMIEEAYTGAIGPAATGLRIQSITIADGVMTITGRIR